jgi:hypothetical protein
MLISTYHVEGIEVEHSTRLCRAKHRWPPVKRRANWQEQRRGRNATANPAWLGNPHAIPSRAGVVAHVLGTDPSRAGVPGAEVKTQLQQLVPGAVSQSGANCGNNAIHGSESLQNSFLLNGADAVDLSRQSGETRKKARIACRAADFRHVPQSDCKVSRDGCRAFGRVTLNRYKLR